MKAVISDVPNYFRFHSLKKTSSGFVGNSAFASGVAGILVRGRTINCRTNDDNQ